MSRIWGIVVGLCAVVGVGTILYFTLGKGNARVETAKEKALKWIDKQLGETDVTKKEIELTMKEVREAKVKIQAARVESEVRAKNLKRELDQIDKQMDDCKTAMAVLKDKLEGATTTVSIGGKEVDKAEARNKLTQLVKAYKAWDDKKTTLSETYNQLSETAVTLKEREDQVAAKIVALDNAMDKLKTKIRAMESQKVATQALSDTDDTLADKIANIEKKISDLDVNVTVAKTVEDEKWKAAANHNLGDVGKIIDSTKDDKDLLNDVNAILKDKK